METVEHRVPAGRRMISPIILAQMLDVPVQTVYTWRSRGGGPPAYRVGRHLRYRPEDVDAWLSQRRDSADNTEEG